MGGMALRNESTGTLIVSGGHVSSTLNNQPTVRNNSTGTFMVTGGTVTGPADVTVFNNQAGSLIFTGGIIEGTRTDGNCRTVRANNGGRIEVSGDAMIIGRDNSATRGVIQMEGGAAVTFIMTGGTIENTQTGGGNTIYNQAPGTTIDITGGTVIKRGTETSGWAVFQNATTGSSTITIGEDAEIIGRVQIITPP
jgi:hypothetical protein